MSPAPIAVNKPEIQRFHHAFLKLGIDPCPIYKQLNIPFETMSAQSATLPMGSYYTLLNQVADSSNRRFLAADISLLLETNDMGVLAYILRCAENFNMLIQLLQRYVSLVTPGAEVSLLEHEQNYVLTYGNTHYSAALQYQDVEGTIAQFVLIIRELLANDSWLAPEIYFKHCEKNSDDTSSYPFAEKVFFNHHCSGVSFPKDIIRTPIEGSDSKLLEILEEKALRSCELIQIEDNFVNKVRLLVSSGIKQSNLSSEKLAEALGVSRRTLNRRLQDAGTSYNTLREEALIDLAKESLITTSSSVAEIAQSLGYSESSAFNRLFKKSTGGTPLQYRKQQRRQPK